MIAQLLNRNFVLEQLQDVQDKLAAFQEDSIKGAVWQGDLPVMGPGEMRAAHEDVSAAIEREKKESSGQGSWAGTERTPRTRLEDFSFFSRDPLINNLQSALEMYLRVKEPHRRQVKALKGTGGFAQAFITIGGAGIIAALWPVDDARACEVATGFYDTLRDQRENLWRRIPPGNQKADFHRRNG